MEPFDPRWQRLVNGARQAQRPVVTGPPLGFATRVVARWRAGDSPVAPLMGLWEGLSLRAALAAFTVLIVSSLWLAMTPAPGGGWGEALALTDSVLHTLYAP